MATKKKSARRRKRVDANDPKFKTMVRQAFRNVKNATKRLELSVKALKMALDPGTFNGDN